jgi:hypothetical protein
MMVLKQCQCIVNSKEINLFSGIQFQTSKVRENEVVFKLKEIRGINLKKIYC